MNSTALPQSGGYLRRIHPPGQAPDRLCDINIIFVPDLRLASGPEENYTWVNGLTTACSKEVGFLEFSYRWHGATLPIWQGLIHRSGELVRHLHKIVQHQQQEQLNLHPVLLVGHGLGGVIIKHFLNTLFDRYYDPLYSCLRDIVAGCVFLGTPHVTKAFRGRWLSLSLILRANLRISGHLLAQAELEAATVANISERFEEYCVDLPIISAYESKKTQIGDNFFRFRKQLLVDRELASISLEREEVIEVNEDHRGIGFVKPDSDLFQKLVDLINSSESVAKDMALSIASEDRGRNFATWATTASDVEPVVSPARGTGGSSHEPGEDAAAVEFVDVRTPLKLPCYLIKAHSKNADFVGRSDVLKTLADVLLPPEDPRKLKSAGLRTYALCGMGGLGKTQSALEFTYSNKKAFDAVFWVQADSNVKLDESFANIAVELGLLSANDAKDRVVSRNAVLEWLQYPTKDQMDKVDDSGLIPELANWLLVFDNAEDLIMLRDYTPIDGIGAILLTSRNPATKFHVSPNAGIDLQPLDPAAALAFIQKSAYECVNDEDRTTAQTLVNRLGGLPLAIAQIAGIINQKDLTFAECLDEYEKESILSDTRALSLAPRIVGYEHSLATVWALDGLSPRALCLLQVLSFLDPDVIAESILQNSAASRQFPDFPTPDLFVDCRTELMGASLVKRNRREKTLSVHRVLQDVTRGCVTNERRNGTFMLVVELLSGFWQEDREWAFGYRTSEWQAADSMISHILALKRVYLTYEFDLSSDPLTKFVSLLSRGSTHLLERANFAGCLELAALAHEISQKHVDIMGEAYADVLMTQSTAYAALGNRKECLHYGELHFKERIAFENSIGRTPESELSFEAMAFTALALGLVLNERYEEAIPLCNEGQVKHEMVEAFREDRYWPHWAHAYRAWALIGLNRAEEALPSVMATLKWRERHYGKDDTESLKGANVLQILGVIYEHQDKYEEALLAFERSLPLYSATEGDSSFRTNQVRVKLAEHYARLRRPEAAIMMFDTALKYWRVESAYSPELARTLYKKSIFLDSFGNAEEGDEVRAEAEEVYFKIHPQGSKSGGMRPVAADSYDKAVMIMSR